MNRTKLSLWVVTILISACLSPFSIGDPNKDLPKSIASRLQKLRKEGPKIPVYLEIHNELWTEELQRDTTNPAPLAALDAGAPAMGVIQSIRNGKSIEGIDRETAAGYVGLVTGWLLDPENNQDIHFLFAKRASSPSVATGDVVLASIIADVRGMVNTGAGFSGSQSQEWAKIAKGRNPVMRQIAAALAPRLTKGPEDQLHFALSYGEEKELPVIRTLAASIQQLPEDQAGEILSRLAKRQAESGNSNGADYLNEILAN